MTFQQTAEVLKRLSTHYPTFIASNDVVSEWYRDLNDIDYERVNTAATAFIQKNAKGYMPSIARIREYLPKESVDYTTANRAWTVAIDDDGSLYIKKIKYIIKYTKSGQKHWIEDENGYIYSSPNDVEQQMIESRVIKTGMIVSENEANAEYNNIKQKYNGISRKKNENK